MTDTTREEVNTQEPPTMPPQVTHVQPLDNTLEATLVKVVTIKKNIVETQNTTKEQSQIGQIDLSASIAQEQGP